VSAAQLVGGERPGGRGAAHRGMPELATQVGNLARRSVVRTLRQPAQVVPSMIFPLFLLAVNASGLKRVTDLPGFPTHSYLTFALAVPFMQGALFAVMGAGTDLGRDIQTGFLNRLALTPLRAPALLTGLLAGTLVTGLIQAAVYLIVGLAAGAHLAAGVGGVLVIVALSLLITLAFSAIGVFAALRTGSAEAVQGLFPLFFVFLFLSSGSLPRNVIQTDWFREIATYNPVSYLIEGIRSLFVTGWDAEALALGFGIAGGMAVIALALASAALKTRLTRT
jgi:ABC-2 type transport system permease protein